MITFGRICVALLVVFVLVDFLGAKYVQKEGVVLDKQYRYKDKYVLMVEHSGNVVTLDVDAKEYYSVKINKTVSYSICKGLLTGGVWSYKIS